MEIKKITSLEMQQLRGGDGDPGEGGDPGDDGLCTKVTNCGCYPGHDEAKAAYTQHRYLADSALYG